MSQESASAVGEQLVSEQETKRLLPCRPCCPFALALALARAACLAIGTTRAFGLAVSPRTGAHLSRANVCRRLAHSRRAGAHVENSYHSKRKYRISD